VQQLVPVLVTLLVTTLRRRTPYITNFYFENLQKPGSIDPGFFVDLEALSDTVAGS